MHPVIKNRLRVAANRVDPDRLVRNLARASLGRLRYRHRSPLSDAEGNRALGLLVARGAPAAVGKIGASELRLVRHFVRRLRQPVPYPDWLRQEAMAGPGVFPANDGFLDRFCAFWLQALGALDLLAVWFNRGEHRIAAQYGPGAALCTLSALEPYYHTDPWSRFLAGKRVLVVSPFAASVASQYARRDSVWGSGQCVLPGFELMTLACPLSPALVAPTEADWFDRYAALCARMAAIRFDVALIGAGALSIPLCAAARDLGRIGVHLGGATQILFGIKGGRWDGQERVSRQFNEAWVRPSPQETPAEYQAIEGGAYW